jgi:Protein of unknown function (DUF3012).
MLRTMLVCLGVLFVLTACSPEVGSQKWCDALKKKPEGEWSLNEAKDYAKHCLLR